MNTETTTQTKIDFPIWKTVKHPYHWGDGRFDDPEAEIDLILVDVYREWGAVDLAKAAQKAKTQGLTFVPHFILNQLARLIVEEFGENPDDKYRLAMVNDFGEVYVMGTYGKEPRFDGGHDGRPLMQCGIPKTPVVFVKSRK